MPETTTITSFKQGVLINDIPPGGSVSVWRDSLSENDHYLHEYNVLASDWIELPPNWATDNPYPKTAVVLHVSITRRTPSGSKLMYGSRKVIGLRIGSTVVSAAALGDAFVFGGDDEEGEESEPLYWDINLSEEHSADGYTSSDYQAQEHENGDYLVCRGRTDPYTYESTSEGFTRTAKYGRFSIFYQNAWQRQKKIKPEEITSLSYYFTFEELPPWGVE